MVRKGSAVQIRSLANFYLFVSKNMWQLSLKEGIIKFFIAVIWVGLIWYVVWLYMQWSIVAGQNFVQYNVSFLILALILGMYLIWISVFTYLCLPDNRWSLMMLWIAIIWIAEVYFLDNPEVHVYLADILKLVWVILVIVWPSKALVSKAYEEKKFEEEIEIIEV